ncbi:MAG: molybdenum ABC transporter ATP-binding protein [Alcanivoracaceae bacterium]|nr:molybdenum ABC transporter ATP-binding protein [Alcanivoracaceae bacterium]
MLEARLHGRRGPLALSFDARIPMQGCCALFGPSGAGKTSILRWIAGLEPRLRGHLRLDDTVMEDAHARMPAHRRRIGMVFQQPGLFPHLDVAGNIHFAARRADTPAAHVQRLADLLGIADLLALRPGELSGGQAQRVALARALATQPRLLLLDEPFANLDLDARNEVMTALETLQQEMPVTTVLVSHLPQEVQRLADHLVLVEAGKVVVSDTLQSLLVNADLPLAHLEDAAAVVNAELTGSGQARFSGGSLTLAGPATRPPGPVRVGIAARDVSIALSAATDSSISNILPASVVDISDDARPGQCLVRLRCGNDILLARITRASCERLALGPGRSVHAQVKSVALLA